MARDAGLMEEMARMAFLARLIEGGHVANLHVREFLDFERPGRGLKGGGDQSARSGRTRLVAGFTILVEVILRH